MATILACGLLTARTPFAVIVAILFVSGLSRSMEFTTINALSFCDLKPEPFGFCVRFRHIFLCASQVLIEFPKLVTLFIVHPIPEMDYSVSGGKSQKQQSHADPFKE